MGHGASVYLVVILFWVLFARFQVKGMVPSEGNARACNLFTGTPRKKSTCNVEKSE